ncbi:hypothetical protein [Paenibacillus andongensis]|uniref:hypothetical protein n=1 Tax=Paenibacillus andongensis TaxID=2975482 RepID=UPI0021BAA9B0|nr:hypothetical protein [Paenibacillus andongensis]
MKKLKFIYFTLALLLAIGVGIPTGGYANDSTNMQSKASFDVDIPTIGLEPGNYQVMIYASNSFPITINAAP